MFVYQITNKINQKKYFGITNNYKKRWGNECSYPSNPKKRQVIQEAIHKYGKGNFEFQVLFSSLSVEQACQEETRLIQEYHTWTLDPECWGYNAGPGGEYHPKLKGENIGEKNGNAKITDQEAQYILDNRDKPLYVLYEDFNDKISYSEFKAIYNGKKFTHLTTSTPIYPYNFEFSCQFTNSPLDYGDIVDLRAKYNQGIYWRDAYKEYSSLIVNEWSFWNIYYGNRYQLVMPEVFTLENRKKHSFYNIKKGENNGRAKLTGEDVKKIRNLHNQGKTNKEIYSLFPHMAQTSIRNVINNKTWQSIK